MRGSEWRKWNVHVHTKGTNKNDLFTSVSIDDFFSHFFRKALEQQLAAIAITDYFSIDNYKAATQFIAELEHKADSAGKPLFTVDEISQIRKIFIFPNVELRMMPATDIGKLINIHCLFNPEYVNDLENDFFNTIENQAGKKMNRAGIISYGKTFISDTPSDELCYKEGVDRFVVDIRALKDILDSNSSFRNNTIVVVSNSNKDGNSAVQKHYDLFEGEPGGLDGVRKTIYEISNAIFSANKKDIIYFLGQRLDGDPDALDEDKSNERKLVLKERGSFKACLVGCDAHKEEDLFKRFTWIKGSLDFNGFKQIMFEPEQRVKIQDTEPDIKDEKLIIDHVRYIGNDNLFTPEPVYFNRNLNVIIGGKSSGKSILLYNIAKTLLPDRTILKGGDKEGGYRYTFPSGFDFEVTIGSGHSQSITREDGVPSILPEIKYIPQNYLSKLAEPENKKGNELVKLVRGLLLEDETYNEKYQSFLSQLKSNDLKRELAINAYFELKDKIAEQRQDLSQKGDPDVLRSTIKTNQEKIAKLKESAGLTEEQISEYNKLSIESSEIEGELKKLRNDYSKIRSFNADIQNILTDLIQRRDNVLNSIENAAVSTFYRNEYAIVDTALKTVEAINSSFALNENEQFINENIFSRLAAPLSTRQAEIKAKLQPYVQDQLIKSEIEALEKLVNEDTQKLAGINQIALEISKNETALITDKTKIFDGYRANFNEYSKMIESFDPRTQLLENDRLQIIGTQQFNFPKFRGKITALMDGRKANFDLYPLLKEKNTGISPFDIEDVLSWLTTMFDAMTDKNDFPFVSKVDLKAAVRYLLD
ncbi:MAG: TrlF family ATPase, partial [Mucilaginibacter sp.]|uniref:TrlF family ATPase n=1 Tax=Mucilaginibacter sp. TaxID=1882438 RepID=UPI0031AC89E5